MRAPDQRRRDFRPPERRLGIAARLLGALGLAGSQQPAAGARLGALR